MMRFRSASLFIASIISFLSPCRAQPPAQAVTELTATILGSGSPQYDPDRAGPSVLIRLGDTDIIVDTGNGAQAQLDKAALPIRSLDGILFTHHHLDHNEEFIPIFIRALLGDNQFVLAGPAPMKRMADTTLALYKEDIEYRMRRSGRKLADVADNYTLKELAGAESFTIGNVAIKTTPVNHTIATNALRFEANGRVIVVSGDLIYSETLSKLAKDADYLIIDSGGTIKTGGEVPEGGQARSNGQGGGRNGGGRGGANGGGQRAHVTLAETARMASEAGVKTLVLTHFTPGTIDEAATTAELRKTYSGKIVFAKDMMKLP
jgi:ribonuclease BN (tRNA processing enzyme)